MKKLKIAIVTDIHYDPASPALRDRQAMLMNHFVAAVNRYAPDLVVDMGDRVRSKDAAHDREGIKALKGYFEKLNAPVYGILGNRDIKNMGPQDHATVLNIPAESHSRDIGDHHLVFWNPAYNYTESALNMAEDDIKWLENDLNETDLPTVVFSHIPLDRADSRSDGHYWAKPETARKVMEQSRNVILCLSGHDHRRRHSDINGIYYSTRNAFRSAVKNDSVSPYSAYSFVELENRNIFIL